MGQRGRKKGAIGEQSRALLLKIAAEEFANIGYYATKISTIVKRAKVTQPTFYLYFESKEAIFRELDDLFRNRLFDFTKSSRLEPDMDLTSVPAKIAAGLSRIFTFFLENPELTRIGFYISTEAEEMKRQLASQIEDNLNFEVQEGYFRADIDMSVVAECLVGMIERLIFTKLFTGLKNPDDLANEILHLLLYGMVEVPASE
ncbi:TetR/AcrR family transcriptional regulator [Bacillus sp. CGMCC 1.16607]|uniref:TetR/AcrR family transcriptional regulator n=1 Tax=Bacillus sp. CGMCC 1.16607 TaxID=3351842 RepID=UPI00363A5C5F